MRKNPNLLWITVVVLGWLTDFLFWQKPLGINFAIYTVLCLAGGVFVLGMDKQHPARGTLWLFPLVLFFAVITFVRTEPMTLFLALMCTLFLMSVLAMTFLGGRWLQYSLADYVSGLFRLAGSMVARPVTFNAEVKREQVENGLETKKFNPWPILRGIVIAIPIVAIFASLLASADAIFSSQLGEFIKFFRIDNLPQYIFRLVYILAGAYLLAGVFLHAAGHSKDEKLLGVDKLPGQSVPWLHGVSHSVGQCCCTLYRLRRHPIQVFFRRAGQHQSGRLYLFRIRAPWFRRIISCCLFQSAADPGIGRRRTARG